MKRYIKESVFILSVIVCFMLLPENTFAIETNDDINLSVEAKNVSSTKEVSSLFQECRNKKDIDVVLNNIDANIYVDYIGLNFDKLVKIAETIHENNLDKTVIQRINARNKFIKTINCNDEIQATSCDKKTRETITIGLEDGAEFTCTMVDESDDGLLATIWKEYGNRKYTVTHSYKPRKNYPTAKIEFALGYKLGDNKRISGRYVSPADLSTGSTGWRTKSRAYNISKPSWAANATKVKAVVKHEVKFYGTKTSSNTEYLMGTHHVKQTGTVTVVTWGKDKVELEQTKSKNDID